MIKVKVVSDQLITALPSPQRGLTAPLSWPSPPRPSSPWRPAAPAVPFPAPSSSPRPPHKEKEILIFNFSTFHFNSPAVSVGCLHTFCRLGPIVVVAFFWSLPFPGPPRSGARPRPPLQCLPGSVRGPWEPWSSQKETLSKCDRPEYPK